jgi:hypothetical protein
LGFGGGVRTTGGGGIFGRPGGSGRAGGCVLPARCGGPNRRLTKSQKPIVADPSRAGRARQKSMTKSGRKNWRPDFKLRTRSVHQGRPAPYCGREPRLVLVARNRGPDGQTNNGPGDAMGRQIHPRRNAVEIVSVSQSCFLPTLVSWRFKTPRSNYVRQSRCSSMIHRNMQRPTNT